MLERRINIYGAVTRRQSLHQVSGYVFFLTLHNQGVRCYRCSHLAEEVNHPSHLVTHDEGAEIATHTGLSDPKACAFSLIGPTASTFQNPFSFSLLTFYLFPLTHKELNLTAV